MTELPQNTKLPQNTNPLDENDDEGDATPAYVDQ
jgi:hypothetical protein